MPDPTSQSPGTLITNPAAQGFNVTPGSSVYQTSYGYLIVSPSGEQISLNPSKNVIAAPTTFDIPRQTYESGIRPISTYKSPSSPSGAGYYAPGTPGAAPQPTVITDYQKAVQAGIIQPPVVEQRPGEIGKVHPGEIIRLPGKQIYGTPDYGVATTIYTPSEPLKPITPEGTVFHPELGYQPIGKFPAPTEPKLTTQPIYDFTRQVSTISSEYANRLFAPPTSLRDMFSPLGAARESARITTMAIGSLPETFIGLPVYGAEMMFRDISAGKGKEAPSRISSGLGLMATGFVESFKEKPIETFGIMAVQGALLGGLTRTPTLKPGLRPNVVLPDLKNLITTPLKPAAPKGGYVIPGLEKGLMTQGEYLKSLEIKPQEIKYTPEKATGTVSPSLKGLMTREEAFGQIGKESPIKDLPEFYNKEVPSYGYVPESLQQLRYTPRSKSGLSQFVSSEEAVSYIPTFERELRPSARIQRQVAVAEREPATMKALFTKSEIETSARLGFDVRTLPFVLAIPKTSTKTKTATLTATSLSVSPQTMTMLSTSVYPEIKTTTRTQILPDTMTFTRTQISPELQTQLSISPQIETLIKTQTATRTETATMQNILTSLDLGLQMKIPKFGDERKRRKAKGKRKEKYVFREYTAPIIAPLDTVKDINRSFENIARTMTGKKPKKIIKLGRYKKSRY